MGEQTDKAAGRIKQAAGAITGDDDTKRDGRRQEDKGTVKEHVNAAADRVKQGIDDAKEKVSPS